MRAVFFTSSFLLFFMYSCTCNEEFDDSTFSTRSVIDTSFVIKERDSDYPLVFPKTRTRASFSPLSANENFLGYTYKLKEFPLGTALNIGCQAVDVEKIRREEGFYVKDIPINMQEMESFSYSTLDRYSLKSKDTKKIKSGFSVDLKLFSFGNQKTVEHIFTKNVATEDNRVYGQLDASLLGIKHQLSTTSNMIKKIKMNYLNRTFLDELHSITPKEFIESYGALLLTDFYEGGRLTAIFSGIYNKNDKVEIKEKNIDKDINASYGDSKDTTSVSANIGIGRDYYREESISNQINSMKLSIRAIGGNLGYAAFSSPQDINKININLSQWMTSLTPSSYSMVDIEEEGLLPLSEIIPEMNLSHYFSTYLASGEYDCPSEFVEPHIEILQREIQTFSFIISSLVTKTDDRIILTIDTMHGQSQAAKEKRIQELVSLQKDIYGLKIVSRRIDNDLIPIMPYYCLDFSKHDVHQFKKFIDNENNTMYLVSEIPSSNFSLFSSLPKSLIGSNRVGSNNLICWSIYDYKSNLNLYGLTELVKKIPEVKLTKNELMKYWIWAL